MCLGGINNQNIPNKLLNLAIIMSVMFFLFSGCGQLKEGRDQKSNTASNYRISVPVVVSSAARTDFVRYLRVSGNAESVRKADINAMTEGMVKSLRITENSYSQQGSTIIEIDNKELLLDLEKAELRLKKARAEYNSWKGLNDSHADENLRIFTGLEEAELEARRIKQSLSYTEIVMPFDGIVTDIRVTPGSMISKGSRLFSVFAIDSLYIRARCMETDVKLIKNNDKVEIRFTAYPEKIFQGCILSIAPYIDRMNRTCELVMVIQNDGSIKSGMYADVKITHEIIPDVMLVPHLAILTRNGKELLFTVEDNRAQWHYVKTGRRNERFIEIVEGVESDQMVIIDGNYSLAHEANVTIVDTIAIHAMQSEF